MRSHTWLLTLLVLALSLGACASSPPPGPSAPRTPTPVPTDPGPPSPAETPELASFVAQLQAVLSERNWDQAQALMAPTFVIGYWRDQVYPPVDPAQAVGHIRTFLLPAGPPTFPEPDAPLSVMVGNRDPLSLWAPELNVVHLLYSRGWGEDALGEALLAIGQTEDGYRWVGVLAAPRGFARLE